RSGAVTAQVIFTPSGRRGRFDDGTTILDAARSLGVDLDSVCGGRGLCGRCQVVPGEGSFPKHGIESSGTHLSPPGSDEAEFDRLDAELSVTTQIQRCLDEGAGRVTVAIHDGRTITGIWPGLHDRALGVAVDIGSTTIAAHLTNLEDGAVLASDGVMNPQI